MFNVPNPNLLSASNILNDVGTDPVFPKKKEKLEKPLMDIRLPYKSIFDQKKQIKGLFDEPKKVQTQNPNLLTYQEYDYLVDGETQEDRGSDIQVVNTALKSANYILAEEALGRKLTPSEIARQRVSDETVYSLPSTEPNYKTYENLNLMFDVSDPVEENKLRQLTQILGKESVPYTLKSLDDKTVVLTSQKKIDKIYFPKAVTSQSREDEEPLGTLQYTPEIPERLGITGSSILERIGLRSSNFSSVIRQSNKDDLIRYANLLNLDFSGKRNTVQPFKDYLIRIIQTELENPEMKIESKREEIPPLEKVEYGSGLSARKKKAPHPHVSSGVNTTLTPRPYKRKY